MTGSVHRPDRQFEIPPEALASRKGALVVPLVFVLAVVVAMALVWRWEQYRVEQARAVAAAFASDRAAALQVTVERALSATHALAAIVREGKGAVPRFQEVARQMLPSYPGASHLVLAPGGVISDIAPREGNEQAIGVDLMRLDTQQAEARLSRDSGKLTLAGPLQLVQGGSGLVGRLPLMLDDADGVPKFWGLVQVVMRLPAAVEPAHLRLLSERGYDYVLWRVSPALPERQIIASSARQPVGATVDQSLQMPNGQWVLSVAPSDRWTDPYGLTLKVAAGLLASFLLAYIAHLMMTLKAHRDGLERQLHVRTAEISASKQELEATFDLIPDLIWLKDLQGVFLRCNTRVERLFGTTKDKIIGRTDHDLIDPAQADAFRRNDALAVEHGSPRANEEWITFAADGYHGLFETLKTPMRGPDGTLIGVLGTARDITERERAKEALRQSETRLSTMLESSRIGLWDWDLRHRVWQASPTYYLMQGYPPCTGPDDPKIWVDRLHPDDRARGVAAVTAALRDDAVPYEAEARVLHADGSYRWVTERGRVVERDAEGRAVRMVGARIDIHDKKLAEQRIERLAHYDVLTGLPNRARMDGFVEVALDTARQHSSALALIFVDLDRFKNVNDTLGHRIGDALLVQVARRMQSVMRATDMVARQGGDEFIMVLPDTDAQTAASVAQALRDAISEHYTVEQYELVLTPSMGISMFPQDGGDFDALFRCADIAMYRAKRDGRNAFRFFTAEMQQRSARTLQLESALRRALELGEFTLEYQPQVSLQEADRLRVIGVEALLRWRHPELGPVSPAEFIPIAEDTGLILPIGEWVLRTAVRQMKQWNDRGMPPMTVAVNLSAVQFRHTDLPSLVTDVLASERLSPHCLELELTEGVAMDDPEGAIAVMDQLHRHGVQMSIDDFGTGYSSLGHLKRFQVSKLKIDQSFVRNIGLGDSEDRAIVCAIINLASSLGLRTIAEGVETKEQLEFLLSQGCREVQGYYFSKPLPPENFEAFVRQMHGSNHAASAQEV